MRLFQPNLNRRPAIPARYLDGIETALILGCILFSLTAIVSTVQLYFDENPPVSSQATRYAQSGAVLLR